MDAVFDKNMDYLKKHYSHVYKIISQLGADDHSKKVDVNIEKTKNDLPNIRVKTNTSNFYLHSNYNPEKEIDTLFATLDLENKDTIMILGFGMGYHIEKLIRAFPNKNKMIVEPDPWIFRCILQNKDITPILRAKNIELFITEDHEHVVKEIGVLYYQGRVFSIEFLALPSYARLYAELMNNIKISFTSFLRNFACNVTTMMVRQKDWLHNYLINLRHLPASADIQDFTGKFNNMPAIMVSAGPSLKKNINLLKEVGDKALIVANGSTISVLQKEGIKPHIMVGIDGHPKMSEIFKTVKWTDVIFAYTLNLHLETLNFYQGPKIFCRTNVEPWVYWMEGIINHRTNALMSGGSCANIALALLKRFGCNPVIMIGQDLAFTDMKFYAEGHFSEKDVTVDGVDKARLKKGKDVYGEEILTNHNFLTMAYAFEQFMAASSKDDIFINATEGGLDLKGTEVMNLRTAIDKYCTKNLQFKANLEQLLEAGKAENEQLTEDIIKFVQMLQEKAGEIKKISEERLKLVDTILKDVNRKRLDQVNKKGKKLISLTEKLESTEIFENIIKSATNEVGLLFKNSAETQANQKQDIVEKLDCLYIGLKKQFVFIEEMINVLLNVSEASLKTFGLEV